MAGKNRKKVLSILLAASMVFTAAGCGGNDAGSKDGVDVDGNTDTKDKTQQKDGTDGDSQAAMGRYVETETDLSEEMREPLNMCMRDDGNLVIADQATGFFVSSDLGATWTAEVPDWFSQFKEKGFYAGELCMAKDGTAAVVYDDTPGDDDYSPVMALFLPDGTEVPVEMELTEEEMYVRQVVAGDDGRIFANTFRSIFEVKHDGTSERILTPETRSSWIWVRGNRIFMDDEQEDGMPLIYDMETKEYIEDEVLSEFLAQNYSDRYYNGTTFCSTYLFPGAEDMVYVVGKKGIHRHALGGNMMEQLVDGDLSLLSNPSYVIVSMVQLGEEEFLVLFADRKLIRFTYDPNVPAVPEHMLTVYSLREDDDLRQAVSLYQSRNPDVFVSCEIGMGEGDAVTREDAIKKLNTELMAGEGPDLIVMDDLPFNSYVEKGMLLDLTDYLAQCSAADALFDNMIDALKFDGRAYVAPATVAVPFIASRKAYTEKMTDLSGVGEAVEQMRSENPQKDIIGICTQQGVLKRFAGTSAPKWVSADGVVDKGTIGAYLEQCKRIYDAQLDGLSEETIQRFNELNERYLAYAGVNYDRIDLDIYMEVFNYIGGSRQMISGWSGSSYSYEEVLSLNRAKGFEDTELVHMQGQCSKVFKPKTLLGISAASEQTEAAKEFMKAFLSADVQSKYSGLPVNKAAYDKQFTPQPEYLGEDGGYSYLSTSYEDGTRLDFTIYWPSDEQIAAFKEQLGGVDTAYIPDTVLEDAVFKYGAGYMAGELSLEEALSEIEKAVAIYMAE